MAEVSILLDAAAAGDQTAAAELLPLVYEELRKLAVVRMADEKPGHTLQPTALVHEAYLRLVEGSQQSVWDHRGHFFAAAAVAMRRILIDSARRRGAIKRGSRMPRVPHADADVGYCPADEELLAIDDALQVLTAEDPNAAQLIQLRYFTGLSVEDAAKIVGISRSTAFEHWSYARARLRCLLLDD